MTADFSGVRTPHLWSVSHQASCMMSLNVGWGELALTHAQLSQLVACHCDLSSSASSWCIGIVQQEKLWWLFLLQGHSSVHSVPLCGCKACVTAAAVTPWPPPASWGWGSQSPGIFLGITPTGLACVYSSSPLNKTESCYLLSKLLCLNTLLEWFLFPVTKSWLI